MAFLRTLKLVIPWWSKIPAKIVLSRLPIKYSVWKRLGLFDNGAADDPKSAYQVFQRHFERAAFLKKRTGWVGLELGPGDGLLSAVVMHAYRASGSYLVDTENYATRDPKPYRAVAKLLAKEGFCARDVLDVESLADILSVCNCRYMTAGLSSLRSIPEQSVDFVWSKDVLEHVRCSEFSDLMCELRRVIRPDGLCSHQIDLKDHLGKSLNNLRFPEHIWESRWVTNSGFYTNRIRYSEMINKFEAAGFSVEVVDVDRWPGLPIPKNKLSRDFRHLSDEELCVSRFDVVLRPA